MKNTSVMWVSWINMKIIKFCCARIVVNWTFILSQGRLLFAKTIEVFFLHKFSFAIVQTNKLYLSAEKLACKFCPFLAQMW
jgi:hypothetical protein